MVWQRVGDASWAYSIVSLTWVVILGAVGPCVGPWLRKLSDGKPLVQGKLAARNGQALACTHFTPTRYVQHWVVVRGAGPAVAAGLMFLGGPL